MNNPIRTYIKLLVFLSYSFFLTIKFSDNISEILVPDQSKKRKGMLVMFWKYYGL